MILSRRKTTSSTATTVSSSTTGMGLTVSTTTTFVILLLSLVVVEQSGVVAQGFDPKPEDFAQWVDNITDVNSPLPSCDQVGAWEALTCEALCQAIGGGGVVLDDTRDVDGDFTCACESQVACADRPTCGQLTIRPGQVEEECSVLCDGGVTAVVDEVQFAGAIEAANKDMTHFVMECRCDGDVKCSDYILFSDIALPKTCVSLQITDQATCDGYCDEEGGGLFDLKGNFTLLDDVSQGYCECLASAVNGTNVAPACSDELVLEGPVACTLQEGVGCGSLPPSGGGGGGGGGSSGPVVLTGVTGFIAAATSLVIMVLL